MQVLSKEGNRKILNDGLVLKITATPAEVTKSTNIIVWEPFATANCYNFFLIVFLRDIHYREEQIAQQMKVAYTRFQQSPRLSNHRRVGALPKEQLLSPQKLELSKKHDSIHFRFERSSFNDNGEPIVPKKSMVINVTMQKEMFPKIAHEKNTQLIMTSKMFQKIHDSCKLVIYQFFLW